MAAELIERAATATLAHQSAEGELTIVLTDDAQLQELNRSYLGVDASTDVLAFPASETDPDSGAKYLGDVLISVPQADAQARLAGHALGFRGAAPGCARGAALVGLRSRRNGSQGPHVDRPGRSPGAAWVGGHLDLASSRMQRFTSSRLRSFGHAFRGWWYVLRTQRNAWLHVIIALAVFVVSFWLRLDALGWAMIVLTTAMVFAAEFLNTAIEAVVDLASPQKHPLAKVGKDVGAGAVMIARAGGGHRRSACTGAPALDAPWFAAHEALKRHGRMTISFRFGTVGSPLGTPKKPGGSVGAIPFSNSIGLRALELGWVQSVRVSEETCASIHAAANEYGVALSVHAPYYINLNAEAQEWPKSRKRLMDAAHYGNLAGASDIIFHPGSYFGREPAEVLRVAIPRLQGCVDELRRASNPVILRPETMGKSAMLGSLTTCWLWRTRSRVCNHVSILPTCTRARGTGR